MKEKNDFDMGEGLKKQLAEIFINSSESEKDSSEEGKNESWSNEI